MRKRLATAFFLPVERFCYRVCRIDPDSEQRWRSYIMSMLAYTLVGGLLTYGVLRLQAHLPGNPDHYPNVPAGRVVQHGDQLHDQHQLAELHR